MNNTTHLHTPEPQKIPNLDYNRFEWISNGWPTIDITHFWQNNLWNLIHSIEKIPEGQEWEVLVVRCWNKNKADVKIFLERIQKFIQTIPSIKGLIVSINNDWEKDEITTKSLISLSNEYDFPIVPLSVNSYTWTAWLNGPVAVLKNMLSEGWAQKLKIINMSFDVDMSESELWNFQESLENDYTFSIRHSADWSIEEKYEKHDIVMDGLKRLVRWEKITEEETVELIYFLRNTLWVYPINKITEMWGFNPLCNGQKFTRPWDNSTVQIFGMEDLEMWYRMISSQDKSALRWLLKSVKNPVEYTDIAWKNLIESKKIIKWTNEKLWLFLIFDGKSLRVVQEGEDYDISKNGFVIPEELRDFRLNKQAN